nr:hypothetical protein [Nitrobacter winogradskyi]
MLLKKILGFAALGALLIVAAPAQQAQAATPISPGIVAGQNDAGKLTTNVQWGHHHNRHWHHHHHRRHWGHHHHHRNHWRNHRHHHRHHHHHRHWR